MMCPEISDETMVTRCPACGQPVEEFAETCSLCNFTLALPDRHATSEDATPFAHAHERGESGRRRMCEWVWFAGTGRLKHLALMRASVASNAFFRLNVLLFAAAFGLVTATHFGWRAVTARAALEPSGSVKPLGGGWLHVAQTPNPYRRTAPADASLDLWWSPPQAIIAAVAGFIGALLAIFLVHRIIRSGLCLAHDRRHRAEQRMTAALHYGSAWGLPLLFSALLLALRPISRIGAIERSTWIPGAQGLELSAGLVAAVSLAFWWFWLVRLGATAPVDSRSRVGVFFGLGAPIIVGVVAAAWWVGLSAGLHALFASWKLHF